MFVCNVFRSKNNEIYIKSKTIIIDKSEHLTNLAKFMLFFTYENYAEDRVWMKLVSFETVLHPTVKLMIFLRLVR